MSEDSLNPSVAEAVATSLARLRETPDASELDPESRLSEIATGSLGTELRRLAVDLRADTNQQETEMDGATAEPLSPATAARALYAIFDHRGSDVCQKASEEVWTAIDALRTRWNDDGPTGVYARAARAALPAPENHGNNNGFSTDAVIKALHDEKHQRAASFLTARQSVADAVRSELGSALESSDTISRRWAAKAIDYAYEPAADPHAERLLTLTDDSDSETRAAAIGGLCSRLWVSEDTPEWAPDALAALADAFIDEAVVVRIRAAGVIDVYSDHLVESQLWSSLSPVTRGKFALGIIQVDLDESATDKKHWFPGGTVVGALETADVWTVQSELVDLGWPADDSRLAKSTHRWGDTSRLARRAITNATEADPTGLENPTDPVKRIAERTDEGVDHIEARLLRALWDRVPESVVDTIPAVVAALEFEDPEDASREAARTLGAIRRDRPDAVPVSSEQLVEAIGPIDRRGYLKEKRLAALAAVDPEQARTTLRDVCQRADEYGSVGTAIGLVGEADPSVVAAVAEDAVAALDEVDAHNLHKPIDGIASAARNNPDDIAPHADSVVAALGHHRAAVRAAAARAILALGESQPEAVPSPAKPLLDAENQTAADEWPLGVVAVHNPEATVRLVTNGLSTDLFDRYSHANHIATLITEVAAGEPAVGATITSDLLTREYDDRENKRLCRALQLAAENGAADTIRKALAATYDSNDAFLADMSDQDRAETVLSLTGFDE